MKARRLGFPAAAAAAAFAAVSALGAEPEAAAGDAMFRVDPAHGGVYAASPGPSLSGVRWKFETRGPVRGSPVVSGGKLLFGSGDGNLYALDAATGRELWRAALGGAVASTPAVSSGLVFATSRQKHVTALDLDTGKVRWRFETGPDRPFDWEWDFWLSSPVVDRGTLYVGSGDGNLYAFEALSGRKLWEHPTGGRVRSSPAVAEASSASRKMLACAVPPSRTSRSTGRSSGRR